MSSLHTFLVDAGAGIPDARAGPLELRTLREGIRTMDHSPFPYSGLT
jgi:hypothetical protein